ncbi:MAG: hypothetical protein F9K43_19245 [Bauldia sp.]|nr:MAG: hypothetical protein F9K43_19245 [Bauldia sp.]MBZ0230649.1 hypothetical protein [Bauldia sp.]
MRSLSVALAAFLFAGVTAGAEETQPYVGPSGPTVSPEVVEPAVAAPGTVPAEAAPEESRAVRIDRLIETLRATKDERAGRDAERALLELWLASGSDTVDLLMSWSLKAMENKNYALALDFLDRITIMKPDYAEGWNKRATVHFLLDDYGRSLADIARVLELEPRHFGALSGLALVFRGLEQNQRAIAAYRQALAIDPYLDDVRNALDELEAKTTGSEI